MPIGIKANEVLELNFNFSSQKRAFEVIVLVDPERLEGKTRHNTTKDLTQMYPYHVNEILGGEKDKLLGEIIESDDQLTQSCADIISKLVNIILTKDPNLQLVFQGKKFYFKANSLTKHTLQ